MTTATSATSRTLSSVSGEDATVSPVILEQSLSLSVPEFSHLPSKNQNSAHLVKVFEISQIIDVKDLDSAWHI